MADYDFTKYYLGKLCKNKHNFSELGMSLRFILNDHRCVECTLKDKREYYQKNNEQKRKRRID